MTQAKSRWYIATLIIRSRVEDFSDDAATCDEQIRLIRASNADEAYEKALKLGHEEEHTHQNVYGKNVYWEFIGLENLEELDSAIHDGTEIRSRLFGHQNPSAIVRQREQLSVFAAQGNPHSSEYKIMTENVPVKEDD